MAIVLADRVRQTSSTTGTGAFTLIGGLAGYQAFSVIGNGNQTYYTIYNTRNGEWEVGVGTYTAPSTLSRDTVLASSNNGALVSFGTGSKDVWGDYPAGKAITSDNLQSNVAPYLGPSLVQFGAVGDNATDNTAAMTAAEASAYESIYVPDGTYRFTQLTLTKQYTGPGVLRYGDGYLQDCLVMTMERPRGSTGPYTITSPNDIVFNPVGNVVFNGVRASGVGTAVSQTDALTSTALAAGVAVGLQLTNTPNANVKTLDWYEEGTWTPIVQGSSTPGSSTTYTERYARFTRIGNQCRIRVRVKFTVTGGTGTPIITNLPFQGLVDGPGPSPSGFGTGFLSDTSFTGQFGWYALGFNLYVYQNSEAGNVSNLTDMSQGWDIDLTYDIASGV